MITRLLPVLCCTLTIHAADFAPVFTDHAVLQRDEPIAIWGTGREGEAVTVRLRDHAASTTAKDGRWSVTLPASPATDSTTLRLESDRTVELKNIAVGEVWICSGQSNMEWRLNQCPPHTDQLLATADNPRIRQIKVPLRAYAGDPLPAFAWKPFNKASAPYFSAVGYYFAEDLSRQLDVTVGLVNCAFGGTPLEAWMSQEAIQAAGRNDLLEEDAQKAAAFPDAAAYETAWAAYQTERKAWEDRKKAGVAAPELGPQPKEPYGYRTKARPTGLRESMLAVVTPYTARGMLWYRGENNAGRPKDYAALLPRFLAICRADWQRPAWPIFLGQLSSPTATFPDDQDAYAILREAQRVTADADAHSGFVVTLDHGERGNVHPIQKQPVGERFARLALARVHDRTGFAAQSPSAKSATLHDGKVTVAFAELPGKLKDPTSAAALVEIQRASGPWQPAGSIAFGTDGCSLVAGVPAGDGSPTAIRYAWKNFCALPLVTDEDLPVSPFLLPITQP